MLLIHAASLYLYLITMQFTGAASKNENLYTSLLPACWLGVLQSVKEVAVNGAASEECKSEGAGREQRLEEALFGTHYANPANERLRGAADEQELDSALKNRTCSRNNSQRGLLRFSELEKEVECECLLAPQQPSSFRHEG